MRRLSPARIEASMVKKEAAAGRYFLPACCKPAAYGKSSVEFQPDLCGENAQGTFVIGFRYMGDAGFPGRFPVGGKNVITA